MTNFKYTSCRLCLKNITDKGFQVIDDVTRDILNGFLVELKFCNGSNELVCNACRRKLNVALEFKLTCLSTDNTIISHVDCETGLQLDLRKIYMKENGSEHLTGIFYSQKICRLCMHLINGEHVSIGEGELEVIHKFIPQMNVRIVKDPVVCKQCFDALCAHNSFLKGCLDVDQRIRDNFESSGTESPTDTSPSDLFIKNENLKGESRINEVEVAIKTECLDIKSEEDQGGSDMVLLRSNNNTFVNNDRKDCEEAGLKHKGTLYLPTKNQTVTSSSGLFIKTENFDEEPTINQTDVAIKTECLDIKSEEEEERSDMLLPRSDNETVKNINCKDAEEGFQYMWKRMSGSISYAENQEDASPSGLPVKTEDVNKDFEIDEVEMSIKTECVDIKSEDEGMDTLSVKDEPLDCTSEGEPKCVATLNTGCFDAGLYKYSSCEYKTKRSDNLARHQLTHKEQMHKCDWCEYKTAQKKRLKWHEKRHKEIPEDLMYKCDVCNYKTIYKKYFTTHQLRHKDITKKEMYECNRCEYKTGQKQYFAKHQRKHKHFPEEQMYKCDECSFETLYKERFKQHQLRHKDVPERQMYKCRECNFETIYKKNFVRHKRMHRDIPEEKMYKCDWCEYKSGQKEYFAKHLLRHKDIPEEQMYKCDECNFKTTYKESLTRHQRMHKNIPEEQMYKCNECNFKSIHKKSVTRHQLRHKVVPEEQIYKCDCCEYKTGQKRCFAKHLLRHKSLPEGEMYKCDECNFKTIYKENFTRHQLRHKDVPEEQMYKCDRCEYKSGQKEYFAKHLLRHKSIPEKQMHKCDQCNFKTIHKENFTLHQLRHKDIPEEQTCK